jgi:hypothetical protein
MAVPYANLANPQTLNLYAMVSDDPETSADLDGHTQGSTANSPCSYESQQQCNNQQQQQSNDAADAQQQKPNGGTDEKPPEPNPPTSWKPGQPLPKDPSGLGPDWHKDDRHKNPNGEQWVNDKTGEKVEFERGRPGQTGEKRNDHWHYTPPDGDRGKEHIRPGDVGKLLLGAVDAVAQAIRDHPVATVAILGGAALAATILTGGAAAPALAFAF